MLKKLLPYIAPVIVFLFNELFLFKPNVNFVFIFFSLFLIFYTLKNISNHSAVKVLNFAVFPMLLEIVMISHATIAVSRVYIHSLVFFTSFIMYIFFRLYKIFCSSNSMSEVKIFENFFSFGYLLIFFFFTSTLYAFQSFLNLTSWWLLLVYVVVSGLIVFKIFFVNSINKKENFHYIFILSLILTEIFWAAAYLPLKHNVLGIIVSICYYMLIGIIRHNLKHRLNINLVKKYLGFGIAGIILLFLTSKWL